MNLNITAHLWINASYESHWYGFEPFCALWSEIPSWLSCSTVWKSQTSVWGQPGFTFIHLGNTTSLEKPHALILKVELLLTSFLQINWCETPPPWWRWFSFTFSTLGLDWEIPAQLLLHLCFWESTPRGQQQQRHLWANWVTPLPNPDRCQKQRVLTPERLTVVWWACGGFMIHQRCS